MAHFAQLDDNNIVTGVFVVNNDVITDENGDEQESLGQTFFQNHHGDTKTYKKCSYNTARNIRLLHLFDLCNLFSNQIEHRLILKLNPLVKEC